MLLSAPFNFLLTIYAHGIVIGTQSDVRELATSVDAYLQIPNFLITFTISMLVPIGLLFLLIIRRRFFDIIGILSATIIAFLGCYIALMFIQMSNLPNLRSGYITFMASGEMILPSWAAITVSMLVISGVRAKEQIVRACWVITFISAGLVVILGLVSLMSMCLAIQIGYFSGFIIRFALGQVSRRLTHEQLIQAINYCGVAASQLSGATIHELPELNSSRKRFYVLKLLCETTSKPVISSLPSFTDSIDFPQNLQSDNLVNDLSRHSNNRYFNNKMASNSSFEQEKTYKVVVFDEDRKAITLLSQIWKFLKYKDVSLKYKTLEFEFEHIALMNYAVNSAGLNYPKLVGSALTSGTMVFTFQDDLSRQELHPKDLTPEMQREFWDELDKAHNVGISYHSIDLPQLCMYQGKVAIWQVEHGQIASSKLFKRLDSAQLLTALATLSTPEVAVAVFMAYMTTSIPDDKVRFKELSEISALLDKLIMPLFTRQRLKEISQLRSASRSTYYNPLRNLRELLEKHIVDEFDSPLVPVVGQYKRFSLRNIVMIGLTIFAVMTLLTWLDLDAVIQAFGQSNHWWALASFSFGFLTFLGGAVALKGFGYRIKQIKLLDVFCVQVAAGWTSVQLPAGLGPITMNIRYLNRMNYGNSEVIAQNSAVASIVQVAQVICSFTMLFVFGMLSGQQIVADTNETSLAIIAVVAIIAVGGIGFLIPSTRRYLLGRIMPLIGQFVNSFLTAIRSPSNVLLGLAGCLVQELGYVLALYAALEAFNQPALFVNVALVFLVANAAGSTVPTPGGLGTIEATLTLGLTTIGIPATVALSVTILYRIVIFWLRIPIGIFTLKLLEWRDKI